jgi:hypothetical protein
VKREWECAAAEAGSASERAATVAANQYLKP